MYTTLFAKRFFYKWNRTLLRCALSGLGVGNCSTRSSGERQCLKTLIQKKEKPTILDVGANQGDWSKLALSINPTAQIFAFEPQKKIFKKLEAIQGIHAFNLGCGSKIERLPIYSRPTISTHSSLCKEVLSNLDEVIDQEEVEMTTIDEFIDKQKLEKIDLLKIDVEGFELEVLKGAKNAINRGIIEAIQFEFNTMNIYKRVFFKDFYAYLPHYTFYRLLPNGKIPLRQYDPTLHELFCFQNILAIRR